MVYKIVLLFILFGSFLVLDLVYFFPVLLLILIILNSIEKDLKLKDRRTGFRS